MTKRLFGSIFMASALAILLIAVSMLFFSASSQAGVPTAAGMTNPNMAAAQSTQVAKANQSAGTWADIAPFPTVQIEFTPAPTSMKLKRAGASAFSLTQKLYVLGGRHGIDGEDTTRRQIYEYTPGSPGTWVQKNALLDQNPVGSRWTANMAVAELTGPAGPKIYAVGGNSIDSVPTPGVRTYDPVADVVNNAGGDNWPDNPVHVPGGWAVVNNKLYVFGGFSSLGSGRVFSDTWEYNPLAAAGSQWQRLASADLSVSRGFIAGAALDGKIYAIGGDTWSGTSLVPSTVVEMLDPSAPTPTWTTVASLPTARGDMGAWAYDSTTNYEISGRIAVAGGVYQIPDDLGYLYNPTTNSWSSFPSMIHATRNYGFAQLNGYLYAFGGYDYTTQPPLPRGANWNQRYDATAAQGTPTPTVTGTPPTSTQTRTATRTGTALPSTNTPQPTATSCGSTGNYAIATATGTIIPGTVNTGSACDDCVTDVVIPFPFRLYDQTFTGVGLDSNGRAIFPSGSSVFTNSCLPTADAYTIFPYWDDLRTDASGSGIFTSVSGVAPNRIFNIEWRTTLFSGGAPANFELRLYEGTTTSRFEVVYGVTPGNGSATGGVQRNNTQFTQDFCNGAGGAATGVKVYTLPPCGSATPATATSTPVVPTVTLVSTVTPTSTVIMATSTGTATTVPPTITRTATLAPPTLTATITPTISCAAINAQVNIESFSFQPQNMSISVGSTVQWTNLDPVAHNAYSEGNWTTPLLNQGESFSLTFNTAGTYNYICQPHPFMTGTITVIGGCTPTVPPPTVTSTPVPPTCNLQFSDVPSTNAFYPFVRCLACRGIISGYSDGTFRPNNQVTRGQLSKMVSNSAGYNESITGQTFQDVPPSNTFYVWIERLTRRGHMTGYACGGPGEPCVNNRPYFRPFANATRGQISKIVSNAAGYNENYTGQTFQDVPTSNEFYQFIERLANRGIIGGYACGGPGEPCVNNRPYFRPFTDATRGQVSKIVASTFYPGCQTP